MKIARLQVGILLAAVVAMTIFLAHVDWKATSVYLQRLGAAAPLILIPYAFVLGWDTLGWKASFERREHVRFSELWRIRVATEAVMNTLPAGVAVGETLKTVLLTRAFGITLADAAANVIVSKFALAIAQAGFLCCGLWFGAAVLTHHSQQLIGRPDVLALCGGVVLLFLGIVLGVAQLAQRGALSRILLFLQRISPSRVLLVLTRLSDPTARLDRSLAVLGRLPRARIASSIACFFLGWIALALEDLLILSLLTPHASFEIALSMEAIVSIVRIVFFFVPAGLGAQDFSYYAWLNLWGLPDAQAVAAAFMLIKRAKEACWIALGYALLSWQPRAAAQNRNVDVEVT